MGSAARTYDAIPRFVTTPEPARLSADDLADLLRDDECADERDALLRGGQGNAAPGFGSAGFACCLWFILGALAAGGLLVGLLS